MRTDALAVAAVVAALAACSHATGSQAPSPQRTAAGTTPSPAAAAPTGARGTGLGAVSAPNADPFPSTYKPFPSRTTVIRNATLLTAAGPAIHNGSILLRDGKIAEIGQTVNAPADAVVIDAAGKFVTPGIIDTHSHIGAGAVPDARGTQTDDVNEATNPVTANVWVEHSVWPQDAHFPRTLAGGDGIVDVAHGRLTNGTGGRVSMHDALAPRHALSPCPPPPTASACSASPCGTSSAPP